MSFSTSRVVWLNNGYGVEFVIQEKYTINFRVVTEKDPTLVVDNKVCIGTDSCNRDDGESDQDFAVRARLAGLAFAEEMIEEHVATLALSAVLDKLLG